MGEAGLAGRVYILLAAGSSAVPCRVWSGAEVLFFAASRPWVKGLVALLKATWPRRLRGPQAELALLWGPPQLPDGTIWGKRLGTSEGPRVNHEDKQHHPDVINTLQNLLSW